MSITANIKEHVLAMPQGEPFTNLPFLQYGPRTAVDKALSRLVGEGVLRRVIRGMFVRPKESRYVAAPMPDTARVIEVLARENGETVQLHGAAAAHRFHLTTQMPTLPVYLTSGPTRELRIGNLKVKLLHTSSARRLQHAGTRAGLALTALWYLGKDGISTEAIARVEKQLNPADVHSLRESRMPGWLAEAFASESTHLK